MPKVLITPARSPADLADAGRLFAEYAASLPISLDYQDFGEELASLPGKYAPPLGALLLARDDRGAAIACGALRPLAPPRVCEMKRLYVSPQGRGLGLGRTLACSLITLARDAGYSTIRLDTLPSMTEAHRLYQSLGFTAAPQYYQGAAPGTVFLELEL